jgi:hypothetical protein
MPGYVEKALALFDHQVPKYLQQQPHKHTIPSNGATIQYAKEEDASRPLTKDEKKYIHQVIGTFFVLPPSGGPNNVHKSQHHSVIASQTHQRNNDKMHSFLDYVATHQDAIITYQASNMVLAVHSDTSYLSEPKACR